MSALVPSVPPAQPVPVIVPIAYESQDVAVSVNRPRLFGDTHCHVCSGPAALRFNFRTERHDAICLKAEQPAAFGLTRLNELYGGKLVWECGAPTAMGEAVIFAYAKRKAVA